MSIPTPFDRLIENDTHGKFGVAYQFGERRFGKFMYGREEPLLYIGNQEVDFSWHAKDITPVSRFGIYRRFTQGPIRRIVKNRFYIPKNPRTIPQQARRTVYANGIVAWQALTSPQKDLYNQRAKSKSISGYNLFMQEYLRSN